MLINNRFANTQFSLSKVSNADIKTPLLYLYMDVSNIFLTSIYDEFTFIATVDLKSFDYLIKLPANQDSEEH